MQKNITIKSTDIIKEGRNEKTGKDWILYKVFVDGDDEMKEFTTFNYIYQNSIGQQMQSNFEYNEKFKNWQEISVAKETENSKHEELLNGLRKIFELLEEIKNK